MKKLLFTGLILGFCASVFAADSTLDFLLKSDQSYKDVVVQKVLSGDTFMIASGLARGEKIKLLGIEAPEPPKKENRVERDKNGFLIQKEIDPTVPIVELSRELLEELILGKHLRLEFDVNKKDKNDETVAYAFRMDDDLFINAEILRQGLASLAIRPPNTRYADQLRSAYQEARKDKRGLLSE